MNLLPEGSPDLIPLNLLTRHVGIFGATGSGKSELLRTLVLGLAMTHDPSELNFVLVDFKGGATFLGVDRLPHVSAVITNLADELPLVDRMRDAISGELNRRRQAHAVAAGSHAHGPGSGGQSFGNAHFGIVHLDAGAGRPDPEFDEIAP